MKYSDLARTAMCDSLVDLLDAGAGAGYVQIRTGAAPAATTDANSGTLLGTLTLSDPAFGAAVAGVATAAAVTSDSSADATGAAAHFRAFDSNNVCIIQGTVGTAGADMNLNTVSIQAGATIAISSWTVTVPADSC